ncbi:unnamed protein product [Phytophthora lilii]|uniref:Unnamed protein product n=1 Tax=Phytophthora lilii TaxID=2077276 RepID=A0A9W6WT66_9STRA|nr:unnamed protein product [Phytophthora lilii]
MNAAISTDILRTMLLMCSEDSFTQDVADRTPLHYLCSNAKVTPRVLEILFDSWPSAALVADLVSYAGNLWTFRSADLILLHLFSKEFKLPVQYLVDNPSSSPEITALLICGPASYRHRYEFLSVNGQCFCFTQGSELTYVQRNVAMDSNNATKAEIREDHVNCSPAVHETFENAKRRLTLRIIVGALIDFWFVQHLFSLSFALLLKQFGPLHFPQRIDDATEVPSFATSEAPSHDFVGKTLQQKTEDALADDDFLSSALAQATGGAPSSFPTELRRKSSPVQQLKTHLQHSVLAHGCVQKWANSTPPSELTSADVPTLDNSDTTSGPNDTDDKSCSQGMTPLPLSPRWLHRTSTLKLNNTYLRNFEGERARYQEILEVTLCYGVQCLARAFSLKGISCSELRAITGYDAAKSKDFYVRNASQPIGDGGVTQRAPVGLRAKPSHSWRDGEADMPDFPEPSAAVETAPQTAQETAESSAALYSLPPTFDEIDYQTKLLGKPLVDLAWKIFTAREGSEIKTKAELEKKFCRVDQRKAPTTIPALELPVTSFAEFLGAYVTECVRHSHRTGRRVDEESNESGNEADAFNGERESIYSRRRTSSGSSSAVTTGRRGRSASTPRAAMGNTQARQSVNTGQDRKQRPLHPQPQQQQPRRIPRSLQHVQSKIQPELNERRQKILRVKKTQSQRMAETLARARLAEYDARRELQDVRDRRLGPKKMPLSEITKGTHMCYGGKFIASTENRDFGPLHTKTVRPEWDEAEDDSADLGTGSRTSFEWNFDHLPGGKHESVDRRTSLETKVQERSKANKSYDGARYHNDELDDFDDNLSDELSVNSDPVFRWLKDAV